MANKLTAGEMLARLKELADQAGRNYYERIKLADSLLQDRAWLQASFASDDYKAAEYLEAECFHDLSGSMTVWQLLHIYRKFPDESEWRKRKWNLRTLYDLCKPKAEGKGSKRRAIKVAEYEALEQRHKEAEYRVKQLGKENAAKDSQLESLQRRVRDLETDNNRLKGRVEELERIVKGKLSA